MQPILPNVPEAYLGDPQQLGAFNGFDLYPMPSYIQLSVPDPEEAANWYVNALGFGIMFATQPDPNAPPFLVHLRRRKYQDILLMPGEPRPTSIVYDATGELENLANRSADYSEHKGIEQQGMAPPMLHITDLYGHQISFFEKPDDAEQAKFKQMFDQS
jgi:hypothetical protein